MPINLAENMYLLKNCYQNEKKQFKRISEIHKIRYSPNTSIKFISIFVSENRTFENLFKIYELFNNAITLYVLLILSLSYQ